MEGEATLSERGYDQDTRNPTKTKDNYLEHTETLELSPKREKVFIMTTVPDSNYRL
jgi:hypothetical protein